MTTPSEQAGHVAGGGLDLGTLDLMLEALDDFVTAELPESRMLDLDHEDLCPEDTVRAMCSEALGVQLVFVPEEYGGLGGGAFDSYRVCERMARIDLGLATSAFATFLGSDPILMGGTADQKKEWLGRIANEGILFAYGATEPEAGSDLGALTTTATPVTTDGQVTGYRITGRKQWISNGTIADAYTILAMAPGGPSWFIVEKGADGFSVAPKEDKHGIRLSDTAGLFLDDVTVPVENLVSGVEGLGLVQAQQVFGYTRVMVAAFGLGCGREAMDRAISYSTQREQGGAPLSEKQGYTHKLIVPHVVRLEAARAFVEETATSLDAGSGADGALNTEGAIAKYLASEAGLAAADAAIQAHGGYGYTRPYIVEKIRRDVRITTIYEGTSEILEMTIARDRWQEHLKSRGTYFTEAAPCGARTARHAPLGRRRRRGARARLPGDGLRDLPHQPAHPQPARPAAAGSAGGRRRGRRGAGTSSRRGRRGAAGGEGRPKLRRRCPGSHEPRLRPRGGADGCRARLCAGCAAPRTPPRRPRWSPPSPGQRCTPPSPAWSPTWTPWPT